MTIKNVINRQMLAAVAAATQAGTPIYLSQADGLDAAKAGLIQVDPAQVDPTNPAKVAARITEAGQKFLNENPATPVAAPTSKFEVVSNAGFVAPPSKRGGGGSGAPTKYPFATMEIGDVFFVAATETYDPVQKLGSVVSSANQRYAEDTGEMKLVKRAKRGADHKAIKGADGKNEMEEVSIAVKVQTRKFIIRGVEAGKVYGQYTAPATGAVIVRVPV